MSVERVVFGLSVSLFAFLSGIEYQVSGDLRAFVHISREGGREGQMCTGQSRQLLQTWACILEKFMGFTNDEG